MQPDDQPPPSTTALESCVAACTVTASPREAAYAASPRQAAYAVLPCAADGKDGSKAAPCAAAAAGPVVACTAFDGTPMWCEGGPDLPDAEPSAPMAASPRPMSAAPSGAGGDADGEGPWPADAGAGALSPSGRSGSIGGPLYLPARVSGPLWAWDGVVAAEPGPVPTHGFTHDRTHGEPPAPAAGASPPAHPGTPPRRVPPALLQAQPSPATPKPAVSKRLAVLKPLPR